MRVLYFSPVPWRSFAQRPQHFVHYLLEHHQAEVCWVEPYPTRLPKLSDFHALRNSALAGSDASVALDHPNLQRIKVRALPIEPLPGSLWLNRALWKSASQQIDAFLQDSSTLIVIGKPSLQALQVCLDYPQHRRIYDAMDNFAYYYHGCSRRSMYQITQRLQSEVDQIWSSCHSMFGLEAVQAKTRFILNACVPDSLPALQVKTINQQAPVFGFLGTVSERFDWQAVLALAEYLQRHLTAARLRIIGPLHHHYSGDLPANIECLPACSHQQAIKAMQGFDVGLIPFHENLATNSIDPVKFYEYHALGLPIVSSYFGEMKNRLQHPGVYVYHEPAQIIAAALQSLHYQADLPQLARFRAENNWHARFSQALLD